jgi:hypothetical protein
MQLTSMRARKIRDRLRSAWLACGCGELDRAEEGAL